MQDNYDLEIYYFGLEGGNSYFINRSRLFIDYQYYLIDMKDEFINQLLEDPYI